MSTPKSLKNWIGFVAGKLPHLSKPQARVLAMWSFGMAMVQSCGLTTVATFLANLLETKENTMRQRLREWYWGKKDKTGKCRQELDVTQSFVPLLQWILSLWQDTENKQLFLAMDATTLGQRFTVLAISVLYRGCAIPVAWKIVEATAKGAWQPYWLQLFDVFMGCIPSDWKVIVAADRGLYADWLYDKIVELEWHPYLRVNLGGQFRPEGQSDFRPLKTAVSEPGSLPWCGRVTCFKNKPIKCTLIARWDVGYADPWLIVTDLSPEMATSCWYGMRAWIECGFKDTKRGGWQWHQTKMTDPARAERLWLAIAVATLWLVSVGGEVDSNLPKNDLQSLSPHHVARLRTTTSKTSPRLLSCFRRGFLAILVALLLGKPLPIGSFIPEPWPSRSHFSTA
ncbi:endonuclease [Microcoleus sp. T2B6]|uniref:transposase n=1 Tax=unclassified Microcoleus TaxID=2642155 RepID=UPI002FD64E5F